LLISIVAGRAGAQGFTPRIHRIQATSQLAEKPTTGWFTVIGLQVEFQPDTSRFTSGEGTFASDPYGGLVPKVDPLPHDSSFFRAHLTALHNYLDSVSDGQVRIHPMLLPEVVRVTGKMEQYSPIGLDASSDEQLSKLASLVSEAWTIADQKVEFIMPAGLDPERVLFVLFHAGIGRDIELVGTTLDKTPLDLPSIYYDSISLDRLGATGLNFKGLPVANTAVIPRTETRRGFDFLSDEYFLVELTTNGLLAASFLNFLGVPDLFNTATGESAIGPFGLMDPLGIFAYGGLIPPEPSAWTKVFLKWVEPIEVRGDFPVNLTLRATSGPESDVARVWISDSEYFLIENRHRDVNGDGLSLQVWNSGTVTDQSFENGDPEFNSRTIEGFAGGVVIGADDHDWALPGGLDEDDNPLVGGILIWHADERKIKQSITTNTVNADPSWRGLDVEEADSGQDLGYPSRGLFGPALDLGTPFDFFYSGNPATVITSSGREVVLYENRFGDDTYPDSRSNEGGPSFVEIGDFSAPGPVMSAVVRRVGGLSASPVDEASFGLEGAYNTEAATGVKWCDDASSPFYAVAVRHADTGRRALVFADDNGLISIVENVAFTETQTVCARDELWAISVLEGEYQLTRIDPRSGQTSSAPVGVSSDDYLPVSPVMILGADAHIVFASAAGGLIVSLDWTGTGISSVAIQRVPLGATYGGDGRLAIGFEGSIELVSPDGSILTAWDTGSLGAGTTGPWAFGIDVDGVLGVAVPRDGRILLLQESGEIRELDPVRILRSSLEWNWPDRVPSPILDDVDGDGRLDVVVARGKQLLAFTRGGAVAEGFPIDLRSPATAQSLMIGGVERTRPIVLVSEENGYVSAFDMEQRGSLIDGFPLPAGGSIVATPGLRQDRLYTVSIDADFRVWELVESGEPRWGEFLGGPGNLSFVELAERDGPSQEVGALLLESETYNWPNPVLDGRTNFRVATTDHASVLITILDMAGGFVGSLSAPVVRPGAPFEMTWETDAPSGLYFARITATSESGRSESRLISLAIVR
jgi:hypothetical protein